MSLTLNGHDLSALLTGICERYEKSAPTVHRWSDELYMRMTDGLQSVRDGVRLVELETAVYLYDSGNWLAPSLAANVVYKLMHRIGQDTTGHAGF